MKAEIVMVLGHFHLDEVIVPIHEPVIYLAMIGLADLIGQITGMNHCHLLDLKVAGSMIMMVIEVCLIGHVSLCHSRDRPLQLGVNLIMVDSTIKIQNTVV